MLRTARAGQLSPTEEVVSLKDLLLLTEAVSDHLITIAAAGDVDLVTAPAFEEEIERALEQHPQGLLLALTKVTFFSSRGVDVLESAAAGAAEREVQLPIPTSNCVDRVVDLVGPEPRRRVCTRVVRRDGSALRQQREGRLCEYLRLGQLK